MVRKQKRPKKTKPEAPYQHKMGYARVSTGDQDLRLQRQALIAQGVDPRDIFEETASGASLAKRREFWAMMKDIRAGDIVYVWKLDRLARSVLDLHQTVKAIEEKGATLSVITVPGLDTRTPVGRAMFSMFALVAEFELDLIRERTRAGLDAARREGRIGGRKALYTLEQLEAAATLGTKPGARKLKMSVAGFIKALERERGRALDAKAVRKAKR